MIDYDPINMPTVHTVNEVDLSPQTSGVVNRLTIGHSHTQRNIHGKIGESDP